MTTNLIAETLHPIETLDALIARHGFLQVLMALPAALLKQRRPQSLHDPKLSGHMRRDIGLTYEPGPRHHWEMR